jgi:carbamoyltransferase
MYILGINAYHGGASACLIRDDELIAAVEEERFRRVKYWAGFPVQAIQYCLGAAGITPYDLDHIGISRDPSVNLPQKVLFALRYRPARFIRDRLSNMGRVQDLKTVFCQALGIRPADLKAQVYNVEHHRAHMASAFFVSPFSEAAVLSVDASGDFASTMWGKGSGNQIQVLGSIHFPHSLGILYTTVSQWLGFPKYGDEGKVMGLAGYGQPVHMDDFRKIVRLGSGGSFELDLDYFVHHTEGVDMTWDDGAPTLGTLYSRKFVDRFGPPRQPRTEIMPHYANVAASLQAMLEEAEFALLDRLYRETYGAGRLGQRTAPETGAGAGTKIARRPVPGPSSSTKALCLAGGVALNSVFNGKILPHTPFQEVYIQPAASDAGTALGAAYWIYHQVLGHPRAYVMDHAYTGPRFTNGTVEQVLREYSLNYTALDDEQIVRRSAQIVAEGEVLGWFQGAMEWGPRALGNRSILADPRREDMKDILNARVKHREKFRPFAPSVLLEATGDYFDQDYPDPFMIKVYNVLPEKHTVIPAVTHVDGTGRLQTVDRETAPLYWQVIKEFEKLTGVPVVLNTSFNENEPIVCKPEEAVECFLRTKMDALVIGNYLVKKE